MKTPKMLPAIWLLLTVGLMFLAARYIPLMEIPGLAPDLAGTVLAGLGLVMLAWSVSGFLKAGTNQIVITAVKKDGYGGGSSSNYFKIMMGEGQEENSKAVIEKTLHTFTRKASEGEPGQSAYTLKAK